MSQCAAMAGGADHPNHPLHHPSAAGPDTAGMADVHHRFSGFEVLSVSVSYRQCFPLSLTKLVLNSFRVFKSIFLFGINL